MEYFNVYNKGYINAINDFHNHYKIKLELLSYYEGVIGDITKDLSVTAQGQLNINYQPLTRRSCSITMINVDKKYIPSPDNTFWFERKFKLWIGVVDKNNDVYWWAQGVFFTQSANANGDSVSIEAVDKGGALDGSLGMNAVGVQTIFTAGNTASIDRIVKDVLMMNLHDDAIGNGVYYGGDRPVDPAIPIIDNKYRSVYLESEISIDSNNYIGDILTAIAEGYSADVYYDINGHFQLAALTNGERVDGYRYMAHQWDYDNNNSFYGNPNYQYSFEGKNTVTVFTNSSTKINVSYTAFNNNPTSPLRVGLVGTRRLEDVEIDYTEEDLELIKTQDTTLVEGKIYYDSNGTAITNPVQENIGEYYEYINEKILTRCKQYADYLLIQEALKGMSVTFESPLIPHLDVNRTIGITDDSQGLNGDTFVIQSITMPLSAGSMTISATNIKWLPNYNIEGIGWLNG